MICKVCAGSMKEAFQHNVLNKHPARYFQCGACGFLQTEEPYWLKEAYSDAIASADTGLMQRNIYLAQVASLIFYRLFRGQGKFLDLAGGYGIFTRLMRDIGFDYYWNDPHASNLVARGFEGSADSAPFAAVTAFEVLEHVVDPMAFLTATMKNFGTRTLLISTETFSGIYPDPTAWWYYAFDTGQHVSFYRRSTLEVIARKLGLKFLSNGQVHLWTDKRISPALFKVLTNSKAAELLKWWPQTILKSRIWSDHNINLHH